MFRRLKVKDNECVTQRQKIKELENTIALIEKQHKTELDFTVQRYENLLKEKDKLHREELELARGLSGAKLTSDDHHKGTAYFFKSLKNFIRGSQSDVRRPIRCQATNQSPAVTNGHVNLRVVVSRIVTVDNSRVDTCRQGCVYI